MCSLKLVLWPESAKHFLPECLNNLEPEPDLPVFLDEGEVGSISLIHVFIQPTAFMNLLQRARF